ncbi:hypothetical protein EW026_g2455 [Hermanssonia centrifuga]|uniref:Beta-xylanase n=1 Tax=Hermanssonia centrifuga TaxID=98765 RepID=A0A4S4KN78_9APHY|nr:hypothetical protein EW026_g2455 [Hermanssonia centrifuga]
MKLTATLASLVALVPFAAAQSAVWGQCGGIGWTGPTTCATGSASAPSSVPSQSSSPTSTAGGSSPSSSVKLHTLAKSKGKLYFGTATDNPELTDTAYVSGLSDGTMFGQITPGNSMKWDATEPSRGTFTFTQGDAIASLAKKNGQLLREPFNDDGTWRTDVFYNTLGISYVSIALNSARTADPNAKLYINDYNVESPGAKSTALQNLVKSLKSSGAPIDGVGLQAHFIVGEVPSQASLQQNMEAFTALGVEVAITELDIRMTLPSTTALLTQQEKDYQTVIAACAAVQGCTFSGQGAACPWDANLVKKPAFTGIADGFGA